METLHVHHYETADPHKETLLSREPLQIHSGKLCRSTQRDGWEGASLGPDLKDGAEHIAKRLPLQTKIIAIGLTWP